MAYHRTYGLPVRLARLFNTYGPRFLRPEDGRVVSNFIAQATSGRPLTIYGDGTQTRSFGYADDTGSNGSIRLLDSDVTEPVNLGNPGEFTMLQLAELVLAITGSDSGLEYFPLPADDPMQRCPDISVAKTKLGWSQRSILRPACVATSNGCRAPRRSRTRAPRRPHGWPNTNRSCCADLGADPLRT